jgi:hypothetical protein
LFLSRFRTEVSTISDGAPIDPFNNTTPDSDREEEVTAEQARWLYNAVNELNACNNALEVQLATLQIIEQRINDIENRGGNRPANSSRRTAKVGRLPRFDRTKREEL